MNAEAVLDNLLASGITPTVTPDGTGIVVPAGRLTEAQRAAILAHKSDLIARIQESARMTADLLAAAMRVCDAWEDTPKRTLNTDTYAYFGEPVYVYSLKDGINDGFLTPFRVKQIATTMDEYVYTADDEVFNRGQ